jgi:hypothetical protein
LHFCLFFSFGENLTYILKTLNEKKLYVIFILSTAILLKKWLHPLHIKDPSKYTQRGKLRNPTTGKFKPGTKLTHRPGPVPQNIVDLLVGTLLGDCCGE